MLQLEGRRGLILLGTSRIVLDSSPYAREEATVVGWQAPQFLVRTSCGRTSLLSVSQTARSLIFHPRDFANPDLFYDDFSLMHPATCPGWLEGLSLFTARFGASVPVAWLRRSEAANNVSPVSSLQGSSVGASQRLLESAFLREQFLKLAGESRAASTVSNCGNAGLKLLWWLASRGHALPPSQWAVTEYLVFCATYNGTTGAVSTARAALLHICRVNAWDKTPFTSGISLVPGQALLRLNRHQTKKSEGLTLDMVTLIFEQYCFLRHGRSRHRQWEFAIGVAIVVAFKVFARWDDARQLRWDSNFFEVTEVYVRFYLEHRKNAQYNGNFVDVAIPAHGARGAYHVIREAYHFFRSGHVLPYIDASGFVDSSRHMPYDSYVMHLRRALVHIGVSEEHSRRFAGQSARAGAATTAARAGMQPYELCRLAGVTSINWALAYMRPDFDDRMQASRAIGL